MNGQIAGVGARWRARGGDERGIAMLTVMFLMLLVMTLSILMLGVIISQVTPTVFAGKNTRTVFAAEAGIDAALGQIRNAEAAPDVTGAIYGDRKLLPCDASGPVDQTAGDLTYKAHITYFDADPSGRDVAWRGLHDIRCGISGPGAEREPTHALIYSEGLAGGVAGLANTAGDRSLETVYSFNVTNSNVPGGIIYTFGEGYCLSADGLTAGSTISYILAPTCGNDDAHQLWTYTVNYQLSLSSMTVPAAGGAVLSGMCITGSAGNATLQPCLDNTDVARWGQLFSWEGGAHWKGQKSDLTNYSSVCLRSSSGGPALEGSTLQLGSCASNAAWGSFNPDPRVGAGAASYQTVQIVNYLEFGRCFDVTDENVGSGFMIVYPCKQDPSGGTRLKWNHKFYYQEAVGVPSVGPQLIRVNDNTDGTGSWFCLTSPVGAAPTTAYPNLSSSCSSATSPDKNQEWTRYGNTGDYDTSFTLVNGWGLCASLGDKYSGAWSKIIVAPCSGGAEQKWNAPADSVSASLDNFQEMTN